MNREARSELLTMMGFVLMNYSSLNVIVFATIVLLQARRIGNEERLLRQDPEYLSYCGHVPSRLIPHVF